MNQSGYDPSRPRTFWEFIDFRFWHLLVLLFFCILAFVGGMIFMRSEWPRDPHVKQILQYQYDQYKEKRNAEKYALEESKKKRVHEEKIRAEAEAARIEHERIRTEEEQKAQVFYDRVTNEVFTTELHTKNVGHDRGGTPIQKSFLEVNRSPGWETIKTKWRNQSDTLFYVLTDEYMILVRNIKSLSEAPKKKD